MDKRKNVNQMAVVGVGINLFLCIIKLACGHMAGSDSMLTDGIHSAADILITLVAFAGAKIAARSPDKLHPQGHEKFENYAALILSFILAWIGIRIGVNGAEKIKNASRFSAQPPEAMAGVAAIVSITVKAAAYKFMMRKSAEINSRAFAAEAKHQLADAVSSLGALAGVAGANLGIWYMEPAACIFIAFLITKTAADIMCDSVKKLLRLPQKNNMNSD